MLERSSSISAVDCKCSGRRFHSTKRSFNNISDTLPFNFLARERMAGRDVLFIDVDYPDIIRKKCDVILQTESLHEALLSIEKDTGSDIAMLRSQNYIAIGCDLQDSSKLVEILEQEELARNQSSVMFIAEVSLTYMDVEASNRLIKWGATLRDGTFQ